MKKIWNMTNKSYVQVRVKYTNRFALDRQHPYNPVPTKVVRNISRWYLFGRQIPITHRSTMGALHNGNYRTHFYILNFICSMYAAPEISSICAGNQIRKDISNGMENRHEQEYVGGYGCYGRTDSLITLRDQKSLLLFKEGGELTV